jgi:hypothetical protein
MNRALPVLLAAALLAACGPAAPAAKAPKVDPTTEAWYAQSTEKLTNMDRAAEQYFQAGRSQEAASIVTSAQSLQSRLLAAPRPTLAAMEAIAGSGSGLRKNAGVERLLRRGAASVSEKRYALEDLEAANSRDGAPITGSECRYCRMRQAHGRLTLPSVSATFCAW